MGLATSGISGRESCGDGAGAAPVNDNRYGDQSEVFISGWKGMIHRAPNMDTLVALGAGASYGYSVYALFAMTAAQTAGDMDHVMELMHEFYFESAAMILTLITVGKMLEAHSKERQQMH